MGRRAEGYISSGNQHIGRVAIDPGAIFAAGNAPSARLVLPLTIEMMNRPEGEMVALVELRATLHDGAVHDPGTVLCSPMTLDLRAMTVRSLPKGITSHVINLEFSIDQQTAVRLERARHSSPSGAFQLQVELQGSVAWLERTWGNIPIEGEESPFGHALGLHSRLAYFWSTLIDSLTVVIEDSTWVRQVLPALAPGHVWLVEMRTPPSLPPGQSAPAAWEAMQRALQSRDYLKCVGESRAIIRAWNRHFGATKQRHLAEVVADHAAWSADDPRRSALDDMWQALLLLANVPHHSESQAASFEPTATDAELQVLLAAVLSNYISRTGG